jgi:carbamoylphosphate synthase small subunit
MRVVILSMKRLFLSNGPGDPTMCTTTIGELRKLIHDPNYSKPIFGICLGNQLLGLAAGAWRG